MEYKIIDNKGNIHIFTANDDRAVLDYMARRFGDYIASALTRDMIVVVRPNGYILAYINTATGEQTVKEWT